MKAPRLTCCDARIEEKRTADGTRTRIRITITTCTEPRKGGKHPCRPHS